MNHVSLLAATVSMGRLHDTLVHSRSADRPRLLAEHQDIHRFRAPDAFTRSLQTL